VNTNKYTKLTQWVLRIAIAGEFIGHGVFGLLGKPEWLGWIQQFGFSSAAAAQILPLVGLLDITVGVLVLIRPFKIVLLWAAIWGFWTALLRPIVGLPIWDFVERWTNWGAPLALLLIPGLPKNIKDAKEWFKTS